MKDPGRPGARILHDQASLLGTSIVTPRLAPPMRRDGYFGVVTVTVVPEARTPDAVLANTV